MVIVIDTDNIIDSKDSIDNRDTDFDYYDYWRNYSIFRKKYDNTISWLN